jgi:hypothetical protein
MTTETLSKGLLIELSEDNEYFAKRINKKIMTQKFKLKKGEILFDDDKIFIKDDAKKQRLILSLILCFNTFYCIMTFLKYYKTGAIFDFWYGLIIGLISILTLTIWLLRSVKS